MSENTNTNKWAAGLVAAAKSLKAIEKRGHNSFHRYEYATAEDVMDACRSALAAGGMAVDASEWDIQSMTDGSFLLRQKLRIVHESGEYRTRRIVWPIVPEKGRPLDKAVAVALTASLAYAVRGMLLAPRGIGEPDMSARDDTAYHPPQAKPAAKPVAEPKAKPEPKPKAKAEPKPKAKAEPERLIFRGATRREASGVEWVEIATACPETGLAGTIYVRDAKLLDAAERIQPGEMYEVDVQMVTGRAGKPPVPVADQWRAIPHEQVAAATSDFDDLDIPY
jgi:hypothetical protein